jgi:hypothetical protein
MLRWFDEVKQAIENELREVLIKYKEIENPTEEEKDLVSFWTLVSPQKLTIIASHELLAIDFGKVLMMKIILVISVSLLFL